MESLPTLFVVDDDQAVTDALKGVARLMRIRVETFHDAEAFLLAYDRTRSGCLLLDYKLPGDNGLQLQQKLMSLGNLLPVIMISGHASLQAAVEALKNGAITFLEKPFALDELCDEIKSAMDFDERNRKQSVEHEAAAAVVARLTRKEKEVMDHISVGMTNKEIAKELGISIRAVEDRRSRMMKKLGAEFLSDVIAITSNLRKSAVYRIDHASSPKKHDVGSKNLARP